MKPDQDNLYNTDGTGDWMLCWIWEYQPIHNAMGWTYYLFFNSEELAEKFLKFYVLPNWPKQAYQLKKRTKFKVDILSN